MTPETSVSQFSSTPKGKETLLFVEDDVMVRRIYASYLRQRGYTILEAEHGTQAFEVYEDNHAAIQLLVTDVVLPRLNGRQLVDLVSQRSPNLKVLYISGFTKESILQRGILEEHMHFLEKPFGREELALRIREILDTNTVAA